MESIKNEKFQAFAKDEMLSTINIVGGKIYLTRKSSNSEFTDCTDDATGGDITYTDGTSRDKCACTPQIEFC